MEFREFPRAVGLWSAGLAVLLHVTTLENTVDQLTGNLRPFLFSTAGLDPTAGRAIHPVIVSSVSAYAAGYAISRLDWPVFAQVPVAAFLGPAVGNSIVNISGINKNRNDLD